MRKTKISLAYLTITFILLSGLLCAIHAGVSNANVQEQLTSMVMELAEVITDALRVEYTYTAYTFPKGIHFYIGEKEDDEECNIPHL